jgi:hypothetical protein
MKLLRRMCARHALVPKPLKIELCDDPPGVLMDGGGFGYVWKCEYQGQAVAVKVLKTPATSDFQEAIRVSPYRCSRFPRDHWNADRKLCRNSARNS